MGNEYGWETPAKGEKKRTMSESARIRLTHLVEERIAHTGEKFGEAWSRVTGEVGPGYGGGDFTVDKRSRVRSEAIRDVVYDLGISFEEARVLVMADVERKVAREMALKNITFDEASEVVYAALAK